MKKYQYKSLCVLGLASLMACADFDEVNRNPTEVGADQARVEYALAQSLTDSQQDPHIAERIFVLNWMPAARMYPGTLSLGVYNDGWLSEYYRYVSRWLSSANLAIELAEKRISAGGLTDYDQTVLPQMLQAARVWRVYLMSEVVDSFGAMPLEMSQGKNPSFNSAEEVYAFMLRELSEAYSILRPDLKADDTQAAYDRVYRYDFGKWRRYAGSMRMRLAMRLSEVAPELARREFEAAVAGDYIAEAGHNMAVQEQPGWNALAGVLTREWNLFRLTATSNNLMLGLGGISSAELLADRPELHTSIKPANYMGRRYERHYSTKTNDPRRGFYFDGLPHSIDPRAYRMFIFPGDYDNPEFCKYPSWSEATWKTTKRKLFATKADVDSGKALQELDSRFTWNATAIGAWGDVGALNQVYTYTGANPQLALSYRNSSRARIFFASWESYFLIAEAALRGWKTPMTDKEAYERAVRASFAYHGVEQWADKYLASESYNAVGTSAKYEHTIEPQSKQMDMVDGYTGQTSTYTYEYPVASKTLYGKALNDKLSKIITQKYIANVPWLPLEAWCDHRRLGLPFFETPVVEQPISDLPSLTATTVTQQQIGYFPQRLKFPSVLKDSNPQGYASAVAKLGGEDKVLTPVWWARKK